MLVTMSEKELNRLPVIQAVECKTTVCRLLSTYLQLNAAQHNLVLAYRCYSLPTTNPLNILLIMNVVPLLFFGKGSAMMEKLITSAKPRR